MQDSDQAVEVAGDRGTLFTFIQCYRRIGGSMHDQDVSWGL